MCYKLLQSSFLVSKFLRALIWTGIIFFFSVHFIHGQICFTPVNIQTDAKGKDFIDLRWSHAASSNFEYYELLLIHKTSDPDTTIYESELRTFTIYDLSPGQQYEVEIRAICTSNISSPLKHSFTTVLDNNTSCDLHLDIFERPNQCDNFPQIFDIEVTDVPGTQLGVDIDFASIELIIPHTFPAELIISLISPSGKKVLLSRNNGISRDNFGDPSVSDCALPIVFTPIACRSIVGLSGPLVGAVLPQESTIVFQDSTNPNGIWKLSICDDFLGDVGFLQYVKINFNNDACTPSPDIYFTQINAQQIAVSIANFSQCDSVIVELVKPGKSPGFGLNKGDPENILFQLPCGESPYVISDLIPDQEYILYNRTRCPGNKFSFNSCGESLRTLCQNAPIQSGFDYLEECSNDCVEACELDEIWSNQSGTGLKWLIKSGPTDTELTGPDNDVFGRGNYIYVEASDPECLSAGAAELISQCLHWRPTNSECNLSFNYHMNGPQSGELGLFITKDGGFNWTSIWNISGDQGNHWYRVNIDLFEYIGENVQLKFSALPLGSLGDVALDEISLLGNVDIVAEESIFYSDKDSDGFGDPLDSILICALFAPEGYVDNNLDCNDNDPLINPAAEEIPCNLIDDNCNGLIDDVVGGLNLAGANIQDASCNGIDDGKISLIIEGGQTPYHISWSNGIQGYEAEYFSITGLAPGFYDVTISDQNNCESILTNLYVGVKSAFQISLNNVIPSSCSGISDASLSILISNQLPAHNYSFIWNNGDTTQNISNITNGSYQVTVTNLLGCIEVSPIFTVGSLNSLQLSLEAVKNISCPGLNDGNIRLRAIGGQSPYQYNWEHTTSNENTISNLSPGTYNVTISDQQGCNTSRTFELNDPDSIKIRIRTLDPVTCPGAANGKIQIEVSGGNSPYSYTWKNEDNLFYSKNIPQARSGWYFLTVTDNGNCRRSLDSIYVGTPAPFEMNDLVIDQNRCRSSKQGKIEFNLSGGTPDYVYLWSNGSISSSLDSLTSGTYTVTINDQFNCKFVSEPLQIINEDRPLELEITKIKDILCHSDRNGEIIIEVRDGISPLEFHWSNGRKVSKQIAKDSLLNLSKGAYRITITDKEGCLGIHQNMVVNGPANPLTYFVEDYKAPSCYASSDGYIRLIASGGTEPYEFEWDNGTTENILDGLSNGVFNCKITDFNGCELDILPLQMNRPDSIVFALSYDGRLCADNLGSASIGVYGGVSPYDIHWNHDSFSGIGPTISNAPCGLYDIEILDNAGCVLNIDFLLDMTIATENESRGNLYKLYPVPANDWIYLVSDNKGKLQGPFHLYNAQGILVNSIHSEAYGILQIDVSKLPPGYFRLVWNKDGKVYSLPFLVH